MFPGTRTKGFYHTPVTKGVLILGGSASLLHIFLASSSAKKLLPSYHWLQVLQHAKVWQILSSTFYFSNARDLLCGSFLIYCFRVFERRFGSRKFSSYLFASTIITVGLQLIAVYVLKHLDYEVGLLPSGPYGMIYALLVYYFCDVPTVDAVTVLGLPVSGKVLNYSVALQMLFGSRGSLLVGACGMVAGILYRNNIAYLQHWLKLPGFVVKICSRTLGRLFDETAVDPVQTIPVGATAEIQQEMQMEYYEQQMWRRAATNHPHRQRARPRAGQGYAEVMNPQGGIGEWLWGGGGPGEGGQPEWPQMNNGHVNIPQQPTVEVSEDQVQTLVEMGFSRQDVLHALTVTNNDINTATTVLLADAT